ncbi:MAG: hypothetical protein ABH859_00470 [Pseudomonadota bacterium]
MKSKILILFLALLLLPGSLLAFPDQERTGLSGANPPYDYSFTDDITGRVLIDDERLAVCYGETLRLVDMASFAVESDQPPALSVDAGTDGRLRGLAYSSQQNYLYATQNDGDVLRFDLANITATPISISIADGNELGPIVIDSTGQYAYIADNTDYAIHVLELANLTVSKTISVALSSSTTFTFLSALYVSTTSEVYFTTDKGVVFYLPTSGSNVFQITVDAGLSNRLGSIATTPTGTSVYVTNESDNSVAKISTSSHTVTNEIDILPNLAPTFIVITRVSRPNGGGTSAVYAYVAGSQGLTVINTADDSILDLGTDDTIDNEPLPLSSAPKQLITSSQDDGYIYPILASLKVAVVTANPWLVISSLTYSSGSSSVGQGESFTLTFQADEDGTAQIRSGGTVAATGTLLTDDTGATSWSVTADTDLVLTFNYDDNSSSFIEGDNDVFIFVTNASSNRGRIATTVKVDTPPPNVTINSTGFGNQKIYVNFNRLTEADLNHYNIYTDTDAAAVLTKTEVSGVVEQTSAGSTLEGSVSGLSNANIYYIAMEAVDDAGNISPSRTNTFSDGSTAYAIPQATAGPVELSGERGNCSLSKNRSQNWTITSFFIVMVFVLLGSLRIKCCHSRESCHSRVGGNLLVSKGLDPRFRGDDKQKRGDDKQKCGDDKRARNDGYKIFLLIIFAVLAITCIPTTTQAQAIGEKPIPQWWSFEVKTGFWMPKSSSVNHFFKNCCNLITRFQGGLLYKGRYGLECGAGFLFKNGTAVGEVDGAKSRDRFSFFLLPLELNFTWRLDYWTWDYIVPYIKAGFDGVYFRENLEQDITSGWKMGFHTVVGWQINFKVFGDSIVDFEKDIGLDDAFITMEAQYQYIDSFGSKGLDLSGPVYSAGLLFEF